MLYTKVQIVTKASMAADVTSLIIPLPQSFAFAVQANYTTNGSLGGVLALQASCDHQEDPEGNIVNTGTFVTLTGTPVTISGAGNFLWNITSANYGYFRLIYTHAVSDSGVLNAYATIKGF